MIDGPGKCTCFQVVSWRRDLIFIALESIISALEIFFRSFVLWTKCFFLYWYVFLSNKIVLRLYKIFIYFFTSFRDFTGSTWNLFYDARFTPSFLCEVFFIVILSTATSRASSDTNFVQISISNSVGVNINAKKMYIHIYIYISRSLIQ